MTTVSPSNDKKARRLLFIKLAIVLLPVIALGFVPVTERFTSDIKLFFMITLVAILLWAVDIINMVIVALALPVAFILSGLATGQQALAPWTQHLPYLILGALIISKIFEQSGLMNRIAYWFIVRTGGSYLGIIMGFVASGLIIAFLVPGSLARIALFCGMAYGICKAMGYKTFSKEAAGMIFAGYNGAINTSFAVMTGTEPILVMNAQLAADHKEGVDYLTYIVHQFPLAVIFSVLVGLMIYLLFRPKDGNIDKQYFIDKYQALGKISLREKKVSLYLLVLVALLATSSWHKIELGWIFIIMAAVAFIPGISLGDESTMKDISYGMIFFVVGTMAIGQVSTITGAGKFIADSLFPLMTSDSPTYTLAATWVMAVLVNFALTPFAASATLTVPLADLAQQMHIGVAPMMYMFNHGLNQVLLPYESTLPLLTYSFGVAAFKDFLKFYGAQMALNIVFLMLIALPYWKILGLF